MINLKKILDKPIAYHRVFVDIAGVCGAVMLSQALYWGLRTSDKDGWFYKTRNEWLDETGLTRYEQEGARKKLKKIGILQEQLKGVPAKIYYRVDENALTSWLETNQPVGGKPANWMVENQPTIYTETTTEITHIYNIFSHWNSKNIVIHKILTDKIKRSINGRLKEKYTCNDIIQTIDNYDFILKSPEYYWNYKWTLQDFLQRGFEKFRDLEIAKQNYKKGGSFNAGYQNPNRAKPGKYAHIQD